MSSIFGKPAKKKTEMESVQEVVDAYRAFESEDQTTALEMTVRKFFPSLSDRKIGETIASLNWCLGSFAMQKMRVELYQGGPIPGGLAIGTARDAEVDHLTYFAHHLCQCGRALCQMSGRRYNEAKSPSK